MSAGKAFFDTNILLYMYSAADAARQAKALALFSEYGSESRILLSTQVVQEFIVAASRKLDRTGVCSSGRVRSQVFVGL